jgi:SRSO17 transposase
LPASAWRRLSAGEGTRGPRLHDWAHLGLADLEADEYIAGFEGPWTRGLPIRRHLADGELAYFGTWRPKGIPAETLVAVEGRRRAIEDALETAKTELGLDHDGTRSRHGWHRHVSLVMLAFAVLAVARRRANVTAKQTPPRASRAGRRSSDGPSRRSAAPQPASPSAASSPRSSSPGQLGVVPVRRALNAPT